MVLLFTIFQEIGSRAFDNTEFVRHGFSSNLHLKPSGGASV